jgi:hypothetical protein
MAAEIGEGEIGSDARAGFSMARLRKEDRCTGNE